MGQQALRSSALCDSMRGLTTDGGRMGHTPNFGRLDQRAMFPKQSNATGVSSQSRAGFPVGYRKKRWMWVRRSVTNGFTLPQWQSLRRGCSIVERWDAMRCDAVQW